MRRAFFHMLLLLLVLAPLSAAGGGRDDGIGGILSWRYADFQADGDGGTVDASSFSQHYSLFYRDSGLLNGGRGGYYSFLLGGEFTGFNNSVNGVDDSLNTYKALYNGQLVVAPGGLPFRMNLYCRDLHPTSLIEDSTSLLQNRLLVPGIVTDFSNGKYRELGASLAVGIKNGSYLGNYRETLSQWPRLLMDYRELEVESFRSKTPQNYRQRDLAFVSLNKKDNWFHYRYRDFVDYLAPDGRNDYTTSSYILGTIDPRMQRAWVNLTNWIKVSADGTFTQTDTPANGTMRATEGYTTNLYATGIREGLRSSVFSEFMRERDEEGLRRTYSVPVTVQKRVDRDTSWLLNTSIDRIRDEETVLVEQDDVFFLGLRVDARQSRPYTLSPEGRVEVFDGLSGTGSALEAGVEVATNRATRKQGHSLVGLHLRRFSGEARDGTSVDYLEEELNLRYIRRYSSRRFGVEEDLLLGQGTMLNYFGHRIVAKTTGGQSFTRTTGSDRDGNTLHSITRMYGEIGIGTPLTNRLQLLFDYLDTDLDGNLQVGITHDLTSTVGRTLRYRMTNEAVFGEGQTYHDGSVAGGELAAPARTDTTRTFSHISELDYTPSRSFNAGVSFEVKSQNGDRGRSLHYLSRQDCRYTFFRINGVVRPLVILNEELTYEVSDYGSAEQSETELQFMADYYPTRHFTLGAYSDYRNFVVGSREEESLVGSLSAGWSYPMLALRMIYSHGVRTIDAREGRERGFKVQLDKTF